MNEDRAVDGLIAEHVFGWPCVHDIQRVPEAVLLEESRAEFKKMYGEAPPAKWRPTQRSKHCYCDTPLVTKREAEFGLWCVKCGKRENLDYLEHYSSYFDSAWKVVEKLSPEHPFELVDIGSFNPGTTFKRWEARFGEVAGSADTAPLAICLAALKAVGPEVPV